MSSGVSVEDVSQGGRTILGSLRLAGRPDRHKVLGWRLARVSQLGALRTYEKQSVSLFPQLPFFSSSPFRFFDFHSGRRAVTVRHPPRRRSEE